jgi:transcriptional repressor NrdR
MSKDGTTIRRRRECLQCSYRYTSYEQIERTELRVVKRDGTREAINREKLRNGLIKACEKRPVSRFSPNSTRTTSARFRRRTSEPR